MGHIYKFTKHVLAYSPYFNEAERVYFDTLSKGITGSYLVLAKYGLGGEANKDLKDLYRHLSWYNLKKNDKDYRPTDLGMLFSQIATVVDESLVKHGIVNKQGLDEFLPRDILSKLPSTPMQQNPKNYIPEEQMIKDTSLRSAPAEKDKGVLQSLEEQAMDRNKKWKEYREHQDTPPTPVRASLIGNILKKGEAVTQDIGKLPMSSSDDMKEVAKKTKDNITKNKQLLDEADALAEDMEELDKIT